MNEFIDPERRAFCTQQQKRSMRRWETAVWISVGIGIGAAVAAALLCL